MSNASPENPIAALRETLGLNIADFAEKLGCSKGHAHDLCSGRRPVTQKIAIQLGKLSGTPWHEWMPSEEARAS